MEIYVWGTGCGASEAIERGLSTDKITAFIDSSPINRTFLGIPVLLPEELKERQPDLLIVSSRHAEEIGECCRKLGIMDDKILYLKEHSLITDRNEKCVAAKEILGETLLQQLLPKQYLVTEPASLRDHILKSQNDYVRLSVLELLTRRLQNIPGALAELGVYKGGFSRCINTLMPERKLYLFDTFSGFDPEEGRREMANSTCQEAFLEAHRNTAAETVLKSMPHPETIEIRAGLFPDSLNGLDERFCLVSLDADFRDSTLAGLRYFWPRLNEGGYLMIHDWGCPRLTGVAEALDAYEQEISQKLPGVPIPDIGNSLIVQKVSII